MSLILDALRKSEAERRLGQAPDLHSPAPLLTRRAPPSRSPWPFVTGAVAVLALAAAAWWFLPKRDAAPVSTDIAGNDSTNDIERIAPTLAPSPLPVAAPTTLVSAPAPAPVAAIAASPTPKIDIPPAPSPIPAPLPAPALRPAPDPQAAPAAESALPSLSALSSIQRAALPPLKMSMHVWAEAPGDRFAIVDGQRVAEGARLPGVVVASIRTDGLVLDIDGRLYLLPRP